MTHRLLFWLLIGLALISYSLPWVVTPGISTSPGAYDLAEWASLHPAARSATPALLTSFLLRLPLALLALIVAIADERTATSWIRVLVAAALALALLPPLEFFTQYQDDPNYRQQFALALLALTGSGAALTGRLRRWNHRLVSGFALTGAVTALWGISLGYQMLLDFQLPVMFGLGAWGMSGCFAALTLLFWPLSYPILKRNRAART